MAEGSRHSVFFAEEFESGVTPANAVFSVFRATSSSLDIAIKTLESEEIRDDAETADVRNGAQNVEGTIAGELSFGTFDELMAAALRTRWENDVAVGSVDRRSFTFVTYQADLPDGKYTIYRGCEINSMNPNVAAESMTTIEFGVVGRSMEIVDTKDDLPAGWTFANRTTSAPMDGFSGSMKEAGVINSVITELSLSVENGIEPRFVVGSKYSIDPSAKRRNVSGSINTYFENNDLRKKFLNEIETSLEFELINPSNPAEKYIITIPRVKFTEAPAPVDGEDDIMLNISYRGLWSPDVNSSIKIERVVATVPAAQTITAFADMDED